MAPSPDIDHQALAAVLGHQHNLISRLQALRCGPTDDAILHRIRAGGPWQRLLPGVYLALTGGPTARQKATAALLYAGPKSVLTGYAALHEMGVSRVVPSSVEVLTPHSQKRQSTGFVTIYRTRRMPVAFRTEGAVRYVLAPRATADAARGAADLREARAVVAGAVQQGRCPPSFLVTELAEGPRKNSGFLRVVVGEVVAGVRSVAEGEFRDLIIAARLPLPKFNEPVRRPDGTLIAIPDAWWPDERVAAEVDSREWHLSPADWEETMRRHNEMESNGIRVLHFSPGQIRRDPRSVTTAIAGALGRQVQRGQRGQRAGGTR
jgi:hypothetical protein